MAEAKVTDFAQAEAELSSRNWRVGYLGNSFYAIDSDLLYFFADVHHPFPTHKAATELVVWYGSIAQKIYDSTNELETPVPNPAPAQKTSIDTLLKELRSKLDPDTEEGASSASEGEKARDDHVELVVWLREHLGKLVLELAEVYNLDVDALSAPPKAELTLKLTSLIRQAQLLALRLSQLPVKETNVWTNWAGLQKLLGAFRKTRNGTLTSMRAALWATETMWSCLQAVERKVDGVEEVAELLRGLDEDLVQLKTYPPPLSRAALQVWTYFDGVMEQAFRSTTVNLRQPLDLKDKKQLQLLRDAKTLPEVIAGQKTHPIAKLHHLAGAWQSINSVLERLDSCFSFGFQAVSEPNYLRLLKKATEQVDELAAVTKAYEPRVPPADSALKNDAGIWHGKFVKCATRLRKQWKDVKGQPGPPAVALLEAEFAATAIAVCTSAFKETFRDVHEDLTTKFITSSTQYLFGHVDKLLSVQSWCRSTEHNFGNVEEPIVLANAPTSPRPKPEIKEIDRLIKSLTGILRPLQHGDFPMSGASLAVWQDFDRLAEQVYVASATVEEDKSRPVNLAQSKHGLKKDKEYIARLVKSTIVLDPNSDKLPLNQANPSSRLEALKRIEDNTRIWIDDLARLYGFSLRHDGEYNYVRLLGDCDKELERLIELSAAYATRGEGPKRERQMAKADGWHEKFEELRKAISQKSAHLGDRLTFVREDGEQAANAIVTSSRAFREALRNGREEGARFVTNALQFLDYQVKVLLHKKSYEIDDDDANSPRPSIDRDSIRSGSDSDSGSDSGHSRHGSHASDIDRSLAHNSETFNVRRRGATRADVLGW